MRTRFITAAVLTVGAVGVAAPIAIGSKVVKKVSVVDYAFKPGKLTITKGTEIKWTWSKKNFAPHNVTLIKGPKGIKKSKWASKTKTGNYTFTRTFSKVGTYRFECTVHPYMTFKVTVKR